MTPGILVVTSALVMLAAFLVGYVRYAAICGPNDWFDVPEEADPWDTLDKIVFFTAVGSSCGISIGCLWGLGLFLLRIL